MAKPLTVVPVKREVIQERLLDAITNHGKVAVVLTKKDLIDLIKLLDTQKLLTHNLESLRGGLSRLLAEAFPSSH